MMVELFDPVIFDLVRRKAAAKVGSSRRDRSHAPDSLLAATRPVNPPPMIQILMIDICSIFLAEMKKPPITEILFFQKIPRRYYKKVFVLQN